MFQLPLIEYSRHLETQKVILMILGVAMASSCLTPKEKLEIACDGKGTYFGLSLNRIVYTVQGKTTIVPLLDYLKNLMLGQPVAVDKKKIDASYGVAYDGKYYEITPIERRFTYSNALWFTRATTMLYHVTDPQLQATVIVASVKNNPTDVAHQAHQSFKSYAQ